MIEWLYLIEKLYGDRTNTRIQDPSTILETVVGVKQLHNRGQTSSGGGVAIWLSRLESASNKLAAVE
jgi:hypothetical protein